MSDQGPGTGGNPTPPHGVPSVGDPTVAAPPPGPDAGEDAASVFGAAASDAGEATIIVPAVPGPGQGTPPPVGGSGGPGGPGGPEGPDGPGGGEEEEFESWYTHPAAITAAAFLGIGAIAVILVLALGGDDESPPESTTSTTSTSTSTTIATTESRCRAGDEGACAEFSEDQLDLLCNEGVTAACQALVARGAAGSDQTTTIAAAPSDVDLCRQGNAPACGRLSDQDVSEVCGQGSQTACDEQSSRFEDAEYEGFRVDCQNGVDAGCQNLINDDLVTLCDGGVGAACAELDSRTGE